jgi:two-component system cell cycle response regulator CpdR
MAKILIVEDDESVRTLAARALERAGHAIEMAGDGAAGLARIRASGGGFESMIPKSCRLFGQDHAAKQGVRAG